MGFSAASRLRLGHDVTPLGRPSALGREVDSGEAAAGEHGAGDAGGENGWDAPVKPPFGWGRAPERTPIALARSRRNRPRRYFDRDPDDTRQLIPPPRDRSDPDDPLAGPDAARVDGGAS